MQRGRRGVRGRRGRGLGCGGIGCAIVVLIIIAAVVVWQFAGDFSWNSVTSFFGLSDTPAVSAPADGTVQVHFIDVGQGDCALILTEDKAILIDSGDRRYADTVIDYIKRMGVDRLDLIMVSHPHADHIGGIYRIIAAIGTDRVVMPQIPDDLVPTTATFLRMLDAIEEHGVPTVYARAGESIDLGGAVLEILGPHPEGDFSSVNDHSIVARLVHGRNSFLFTGDMERAAEYDMVERGIDVSSTVLRVAHHGSGTSSRRGFLEAVNGTYAVISVGSPNLYNHPHDSVVRRLEETGYNILRTDELGNIVFESTADGALRFVYDAQVLGDAA